MCGSTSYIRQYTGNVYIEFESNYKLLHSLTSLTRLSLSLNKYITPKLLLGFFKKCIYTKSNNNNSNKKIYIYTQNFITQFLLINFNCLNLQCKTVYDYIHRTEERFSTTQKNVGNRKIKKPMYKILYILYYRFPTDIIPSRKFFDSFWLKIC